MKGIIIMSAVVPTIGHEYLVDWSYRYARSAKFEKLYVLVCSTPNEPIEGSQRVAALQRRFLTECDTGYLEIVHAPFDPVKLPEHPAQDKTIDLVFWLKWYRFIESHVGIVRRHDVYFGSEKWGNTMAETMGCQFVPCDPNREIVRAKGTQVRKYPIENFDLILPEIQPLFRKTLTIFGAESTGKTTLAKALAYSGSGWDKGHYVHEWARPYLENTSPETAEAKMRIIAHGQKAAEDAVAAMSGKPFIFRDTDLLSTIGFYRLYYKQDPEWLVRMWKPADLYLLLKSDIPFEKDILRYGGDKREASDEFWEQVLKDYDVNYVTIKSDDKTARYFEALNHAEDLFMSHPAWSYVREGNT